MTDYVSERAETEAGQAEIRAEANALLATESLTLAQAAKAADIPAGTMGPFLAGKYLGRNDRIAASVERWMISRRSQDSVRLVMPRDPGFVVTPSSQSYFAGARQAQLMPDMTLIVGPPGIGKTYALTEYSRITPRVWMITASPLVTKPRHVINELREALDIDERLSGQKGYKALLKALSGNEGLIIVDEANHLTSEALDQLRSIHDATKVGVVLAGNERVYSQLEGRSKSVEFAQLYSRIGMRVRRVRTSASDVKALLDAWQITEQEHRGVLQDIGRRPGGLRNVSKTIRNAYMRAADADGQVLTTALIEWAWSRISGEEAKGAAA